MSSDVQYNDGVDRMESSPEDPDVVVDPGQAADAELINAVPAYLVGQPQQRKRSASEHEAIPDSDVQGYNDATKLSKRARFVVGLIVVLSIAVIIGLVVGFVKNRAEDEPTVTVVVSESPTASMIPSMAPTDFPTIDGIETVAQDILFNFGDGTYESLQQYHSPQAKAARWISQEDDWFIFPLDEDQEVNKHFRQRYALATFFYSTGGEASWIEDLNFLSLSHECEWGDFLSDGNGVRCDDNQTVQWLNITSNNLTRSIPEEMSGLENLALLWLHDNSITGPIPNAVYELTSLISVRLELNPISGSISTLIGKMSNLLSISLAGSQLTGTIPTELGLLTSILAFFIDDLSFFSDGGKITGTIPEEIANCESLEVFTVKNQSLTGTIPEWVGNLPSLSDCLLDYNMLSGTIPDGPWPSINLFGIGHNNLNGSIPLSILTPTISQLSANFNQFSSTIPNDLGHMESLQALSFRGNRLTGTIPPSFGLLSNLLVFVVSDNDMEGPMVDLGNSSSGLQAVAVEGNPKLSGSIPFSYNEMPSLALFSVANTSLTGDLTSICSNGVQPVVNSNCEQSCPCCRFCVDDNGEKIFGPEG